MQYLDEIELWAEQVALWCHPDARLLHVSSQSSDIRIYAFGRRVFKIRRLTPASIHDRPNSLEDEYLILRHLASSGLAGFVLPNAVSYRRDNEWECLELDAIEPPLTTDPVANPMRETLGGLVRLGRAVWRLNRAGVSHGDLEPGNIGPNRQGKIALLDFDQAALAQRARCVLRDFFGFPAGGRASRCCLLDRVGRLPWVAPFFGALRRLRRFFGGGRSPDEGIWSPRARAGARGDPELDALIDAWAVAGSSDANSPGRAIAYYSLDVDGLHLPGERPWLLRWQAISSAVDFRGKHLVELGCNLGLLSIFARMAGAAGAVGADASIGVIEAAQMAAEAFDADVRHITADFDRDEDWETRIGHGDIVSALSLTYWLKDKDRLWRYLSNFPEVIFEGHEPEAETRARFAELGYSAVVEVGRSERNRMVFHARRRMDP